MKNRAGPNIYLCSGHGKIAVEREIEEEKEMVGWKNDEGEWIIYRTGSVFMWGHIKKQLGFDTLPLTKINNIIYFKLLNNFK